MALPTFAVARHAAVDRYFLPVRPTAANPPLCRQNKYAFSFLRWLTTWHCPHLLLHVAQQSIDISCQPGPTAAIPPVGGLLQLQMWVHAGTDRWTDGRLTVT